MFVIYKLLVYFVVDNQHLVILIMKPALIGTNCYVTLMQRKLMFSCVCYRCKVASLLIVALQDDIKYVTE